MLNLSHKNLDVWKSGIELVKAIYETTKSYPKNELYGLTSQLRRAAVSVPANIAEGSARRTPKEKKRFYEISRASLVEIDTLFEASFAAQIIDHKDTIKLGELMNSIFAKLSRLIEKTN